MTRPVNWAAFLAIAALLFFLGHDWASPVASEEPASSESELQAEALEIPEHEQPFWDAAKVFVNAYAQHDAEGIGKLFTENAEFIDEYGGKTIGREAIVASFVEVFEASPDALIDEIAIERVRMINKSVALEEGLVATVPDVGGERELSRYVALHVKGEDGAWRINTLKDFSVERRGRHEQLSQLSWLLGEWVSEDAVSVVHTECDWSEDGNYLLRRFTARVAGRPVMNGVQRIGWDPIKREIRSWIFDSSGAYMEGVWRRNGNQWIILTNGFTALEEPMSGTSICTLIDPERVTWEVRNIVVGNELKEDVEPIIMVRKPPAVGGIKNK